MGYPRHDTETRRRPYCSAGRFTFVHRFTTAKRWDRIATMLDLEPVENFQDFVGRTVMIARHRFSTLLSALDRLAGEASSRGLNDLAAAIRRTELGARRSGDVRYCSSCSWRNGPTGWVVRAPHFEAS